MIQYLKPARALLLGERENAEQVMAEGFSRRRFNHRRWSAAQDSNLDILVVEQRNKRKRHWPVGWLHADEQNVHGPLAETQHRKAVMGKLGDRAKRRMRERSIVRRKIPRCVLELVRVDVQTHLNTGLESVSDKGSWDDLSAVALIDSRSESRNVLAANQGHHREQDGEGIQSVHGDDWEPKAEGSGDGADAELPGNTLFAAGEGVSDGSASDAAGATGES